MPRAIQQPYMADIHEEADRVARAARAEARDAAPLTGITRLDIPFWDVFCFVLKFFIAWAIIGIPCAAAYWYAFLR